jgi:AcrR family transcriptional regulator
MELFAEKGFDETTIDDIAKAAEVSRRSFFRYFSSKSDLMGQGMVSYAQALTEIIQSLPPRLSQFEVVRETALTFLASAAAYPRTRKIMAVAARHSEAREAQLSRMAEVEDKVAQALADRLENAQYNELVPRLLAGLTLTIIDVTLRQWFEFDQQDISRTAEEVLSTLGEVIGAGKTRHPSEPAIRISRRSPANRKHRRKH